MRCEDHSNNYIKQRNGTFQIQNIWNHGQVLPKWTWLKYLNTTTISWNGVKILCQMEIIQKYKNSNLYTEICHPPSIHQTLGGEPKMGTPTPLPPVAPSPLRFVHDAFNGRWWFWNYEWCLVVGWFLQEILREVAQRFLSSHLSIY